MNRLQFAQRALELERTHTAFAVATVVARSAPVSAHLADRALILADGHMEGFVGGSCAREIVRRAALGVLAGDAPRLLQIRPLSDTEAIPSSGLSEVVRIPMGCSSEGAVDIFIEPHASAPHLFIIGYTPVAEATSRIAVALDGHRVVRVVAEDERADLEPIAGTCDLTVREFPAYLEHLAACERSAAAAVVASQGHYDETALHALLAEEPPSYVGLLASRKRARSVFGVLAQAGISASRLSAVHNPIGIDLGARRPSDVALSILAEIVAQRSQPVAGAVVETPAARDPVCGMEVTVNDDAVWFEHDARTYYFCSASCRAAFAEHPAEYVASGVS